MAIARRVIFKFLSILPGAINARAVEAATDVSSSQSAIPDSERLTFMRVAIENIRSEAEANRASRELLSESKQAGALFSQLPALYPFRDWDYFYIDRELKWIPPSEGRFSTVRVPRGFVTDLASLPRVFWSIFPPTGPYTWAAIVHDYLYWTQIIPRQDADEIMALGMRELGASELSIKTFYASLRVAGGFSWENNRQLREAGNSRVLRIFPNAVDVSWSDWKKRPGVFKSS